MQRTISTGTTDETETLAAKIGAHLKGGEVIELLSDIGGGKTTFTRGLAKGAGSPDLVSSPTFTISNVYQAKKFAIHHYDFYRLGEAGLMEHELSETVNDPQAVVVVEWSDVAKHVLPDERLSVRFELAGDEARKLHFEYPEALSYLLEGV